VVKVLLIELRAYFATDAGSILQRFTCRVAAYSTGWKPILLYAITSSRWARGEHPHSDGAVRPTNRQRQFTVSWSYRARSALACSMFWREDCRVRSIFRWRCSSRSALYRENRSRAASKAAR
jgi:hypothetical protein